MRLRQSDCPIFWAEETSKRGIPKHPDSFWIDQGLKYKSNANKFLEPAIWEFVARPASGVEECPAGPAHCVGVGAARCGIRLGVTGAFRLDPDWHCGRIGCNHRRNRRRCERPAPPVAEILVVGRG